MAGARTAKARASLRRERALIRAGYSAVAGTDEAGRGCLAGPVVAAAVVLDPDKPIRGIADSKILTPEERTELAITIRKKAVSFAVASCTPREIDRLNILWASLEAMKRSVNKLSVPPSYVLVDGHIAIPDLTFPCEAMVKGDARASSIAAASILAKVERDAIMVALHSDYPGYHWDTNFGYPTPEHFAGIKANGPSPQHRYSFRLRLQGSLFAEEQD